MNFNILQFFSVPVFVWISQQIRIIFQYGIN